MFKSLRAVLAAAVLALGLGMAQAEAAPAASGLAPIKAATDAGSAVEKTHYVRRCWWSHGHRHCRNVWVGPRRHTYRYGYVVPGPRYGYYRHHRHHRHHRHYRRW
jgi:hypothetical protein